MSQPNAIFLGVHTQGAMTPTFELRRDFLYNAPTHQVSLSHVYSFVTYRVDRHTNKQTNRRHWKHPTLFTMLRRWVMMYCGILQNYPRGTRNDPWYVCLDWYKKLHPRLR